MNPCHINLRTPLNRRRFFRAGAVCLALPALEAMLPRQVRASKTPPPKRLLLLARNLGLHAPFFFPESPGLGYESTRYLRHLEAHRGKFTVFSGLSHLRYNNHHSEPGLFTGVNWDRIKEPAKEHRNTVSLDQFVAERIGSQTRFRNLVVGQPVQWNFSWTERGVPVPTEKSPAAVFRQLFIAGSRAEVAGEMHRLRTGKSILDQVQTEARALGRRLGAEDRERLDLFFSSIRETERSMTQSEAWLNRPKPSVEYPVPRGDPDPNLLKERETLWLDLSRLALQTDSTRVILLTLGDAGRAKLEGLTLAHHDASHHGKDEAKIEQLALIEEAELQLFSRFLHTMQEAREGEGTLLDYTTILNASNLGNASAHTCENLPILLAGGGFKHQGHVLKDRAHNTPLSNLYLRILQHLDVDTVAFGCSTHPLDDV